MLCLLLTLIISSILGDPVSELAEMEAIMMTLFPYNMLLNPRVGSDQLAERIAEVFGLDYSPEKPQSDLINEVRPRSYNYDNVNNVNQSFIATQSTNSQRERKASITIVFHLKICSKLNER